MIDLNYLKELLPILRANGCASFASEHVSISFHKEISEPKPQKIPIDETNLPLDLRADDLFNEDKVLHWSGSGDSEEMPLAGEGI